MANRFIYWCPVGCGKKVGYVRSTKENNWGWYECPICSGCFTKVQIRGERK